MKNLNKVLILGNVVHDLELKHTSANDPVLSFTLATNREWTTHGGDKKESVEFHKIVAWGKVAELMSSLLRKGSRTYLEGRLETRRFTDKNGNDRIVTEIIVTDFINLIKH